MKSDAVLQKDVHSELKWEPSIHAEHIGVSVREGVVTLSGDVETYAEKFAAELAVKRVSGVRAIAENLNVNLAHDHQRTDTDIANAILSALDWNVAVPKGKVKAIVENGLVTLSGLVEWNYQREAAHLAVRQLMGVKSIIDLIKVSIPVASAADVRTKIETVLLRNMEKDAKNISIEVNDGKVTLKGNVHSWAEHDDAARAAWSTPGVQELTNQLAVVY